MKPDDLYRRGVRGKIRSFFECSRRLRRFSLPALCLPTLVIGLCGCGRLEAGGNAALPSNRTESTAQFSNRTESTAQFSNRTESTAQSSNRTESTALSSEGAENTGYAEKDLFAMDTFMRLQAYGGRAGEAIELSVRELERLDALLSAENPESEVARLNREGGGQVSEDTAVLLARSLELWEKTGGAFEIALYPVKRLWGFDREVHSLPEEADIEAALLLSDSGGIVFSPAGEGGEASVSFLAEGMAIDFGAIAKGYASARVREIYRSCGVTGIINLGGNVQTVGTKENGASWRVGIRMLPVSDAENGIEWLPENTPGVREAVEWGYAGVVDAADEAVITSGAYERYFVLDGTAYHHILDPENGYPADADLVSASIVCSDATLADALSTAVFVMGREEAERFWRDSGLDFDMILLDREGKIFITEGIEGRFVSRLRTEVVRKQGTD